MGRRSDILRDSMKYGIIGSISFTISLLAYYNHPDRFDTAPAFLKLNWLIGDEPFKIVTLKDKWETRAAKVAAYHQDRLELSEGRGEQHEFRVPTLVEKKPTPPPQIGRHLEMQKLIEAYERLLLKHIFMFYRDGNFDNFEEEEFVEQIKALTPKQLETVMAELSKKHLKNENATKLDNTLQISTALPVDNDSISDNDNNTNNTNNTNAIKVTTSDSSKTGSRWGWLRWIGLGGGKKDLH